MWTCKKCNNRDFFIKLDFTTSIIDKARRVFSEFMVFTCSNCLSQSQNLEYIAMWVDDYEREAFETFWKIYPKKTAKVVARRAFNKIKINNDLLKIIVANVEKMRYSKQWTKDGGAFIPYPATYLNQRRWEDEDINDVCSSVPNEEQITKDVDKADKEALTKLLESMKTREERIFFYENIATDNDKRLVFSTKEDLEKWLDY